MDLFFKSSKIFLAIIYIIFVMISVLEIKFDSSMYNYVRIITRYGLLI